MSEPMRKRLEEMKWVLKSSYLATDETAVLTRGQLIHMVDLIQNLLGDYLIAEKKYVREKLIRTTVRDGGFDHWEHSFYDYSPQRSMVPEIVETKIFKAELYVSSESAISGSSKINLLNGATEKEIFDSLVAALFDGVERKTVG